MATSGREEPTGALAVRPDTSGLDVANDVDVESTEDIHPDVEIENATEILQGSPIRFPDELAEESMPTSTLATERGETVSSPARVSAPRSTPSPPPSTTAPPPASECGETVVSPSRVSDTLSTKTPPITCSPSSPSPPGDKRSESPQASPRSGDDSGIVSGKDPRSTPRASPTPEAGHEEQNPPNGLDEFSSQGGVTPSGSDTVSLTARQRRRRRAKAKKKVATAVTSPSASQTPPAVSPNKRKTRKNKRTNQASQSATSSPLVASLRHGVFSQTRAATSRAQDVSTSSSSPSRTQEGDPGNAAAKPIIGGVTDAERMQVLCDLGPDSEDEISAPGAGSDQVSRNSGDEGSDQEARNSGDAGSDQDSSKSSDEGSGHESRNSSAASDDGGSSPDFVSPSDFVRAQAEALFGHNRAAKDSTVTSSPGTTHTLGNAYGTKKTKPAAATSENGDDASDTESAATTQAKGGGSGKRKRKRAVATSESSDDASDAESSPKRTASGGSGDTGPSVWDPATRKRIRQSTVPDGKHLVKRVIDYTRNKKGEVTKLQIEWDKPSKHEPKTAWISSKDVDNVAAWSRDFEQVDAFKASGRKTMKAFLQSKEGAAWRKVPLMADDNTGSCGYYAVGHALELLGLPNRVNENSIAAFRDAGAKRRKVPVKENAVVFSGVQWPALRAFIKLQGGIDMQRVEKNLYSGKGSGVSAIKALNLPDGVYLIGGYDHAKVGHIVAVEVSKHSVDVHEKDSIERVDWLHQWLRTLVFVRRVEKKKN